MTTRAPAELADRVQRLVDREPDGVAPGPPFQHLPKELETGPLSLRRLVFAHWRLGVAAVLLVGVIALADQAGPRLVAEAVDEGMLRQRSLGLVALYAAVYLGCVLLTVLCQRWLTQVSGRLAARVMHDVRVRVFTHLQRLSLDFYTRERAGVVMTRMTSDVENLQQLLQDGLAQIAVQALTMVVITGLMLSMDVELTLLAVGLTVPPLLASSVWFRRRSTAAYLHVRDLTAAVISDLSENLRGIRVVAGHNRTAYNAVHHRTVTGRYRAANDVTARITSLYGSSTQLLGLLSQVLLLWAGGRMVLDDALSLGELVAFSLYFNRFFQPIQMLVQQYTTYQQSRSSLVKLNALLEEQPRVQERLDAAPLPQVAGELRFEGVAFGYGNGTLVLDRVDLTIAAGETVAFVGPTGAGKSTLARLVMRFYDVIEGAVRIDGLDVRDVTLTSLRRQVCMVPQEAFLFAGTLRDNLAFGRPDATDQEVLRAAEAVGLAELVSREGLEMVVRERGQSLSAGERQLVALARALLPEPSVLVLDEATANLDLQTQARVDAALDVLLRGRTAIVIAHRLSTALKSDRVVVVDGGRVVESGTPRQLVADGGRFAAMVGTWMRAPHDAA